MMMKKLMWRLSPMKTRTLLMLMVVAAATKECRGCGNDDKRRPQLEAIT